MLGWVLQHFENSGRLIFILEALTQILAWCVFRDRLSGLYIELTDSTDAQSPPRKGYSADCGYQYTLFHFHYWAWSRGVFRHARRGSTAADFNPVWAVLCPSVDRHELESQEVVDRISQMSCVQTEQTQATVDSGVCVSVCVRRRWWEGSPNFPPHQSGRPPFVVGDSYLVFDLC